jgi:tRNA-2-methylthio-N6-dimethylallyladenosine synthase
VFVRSLFCFDMLLSSYNIYFFNFHMKGPQYVPHLKNVLEQEAAGQQMVVTAPMLLQDDNAGFLNKPVRGHDIRAWVNIIHGCNEHCTYCVVPGTRGMEQSRTMETVLQEIVDLGNAGYKEVTLLGQNIDAYGRDMVPKRTFAELLEFLNGNIPEKMRIRYVRSGLSWLCDVVCVEIFESSFYLESSHLLFIVSK